MTQITQVAADVRAAAKAAVDFCRGHEGCEKCPLHIRPVDGCRLTHESIFVVLAALEAAIEAAAE